MTHAPPESPRNVAAYLLFVGTVVLGEMLGGLGVFAISVDHLRTPPPVHAGRVHVRAAVAASQHSRRVFGAIVGPLLVAAAIVSAVAFTRAIWTADNPLRSYLAQRGPN